jgi:hypothetical protein
MGLEMMLEREREVQQVQLDVEGARSMRLVAVASVEVRFNVMCFGRPGQGVFTLDQEQILLLALGAMPLQTSCSSLQVPCWFGWQVAGNMCVCSDVAVAIQLPCLLCVVYSL